MSADAGRRLGLTDEERNGTTGLRDKVRSLRLDDTVSAQGGAGRAWLPWLLCLVFAGVAAYFAVESRRGGGPTESGGESAPVAAAGKNSRAGSTPGATSAGAAAAREDADARIPPGAIALESKGYIIPAHQILVSPKVNGMVTRLLVEEGKFFSKGAVLAELETTEYEADVARAKALLLAAEQRLLELDRGNRPEEIRQAEAELGEAKSQADQLLLAWERAKKLRASRSISENDYDSAKSQFEVMQQRVVRLENALTLMQKGAREERRELARAEVQQARAELAKTEWRLSNCTIRAPISGTILKKNAEEGNIVNPVAFNGSFSLCEMADLTDLEVDLSIQERDVARVFKGQKCDVVADAFPTRKYTGYVDRLMPIADRAKGAVPVRVKLQVPPEEQGAYLKPEMGAIVTFYRAERAGE